MRQKALTHWNTIIYMTPRPQERSRSTASGKYHYTPEKTRMAAADIKTQLLSSNAPLFEGSALHVSAYFYFTRPKSVSRAKRPYHTVKPDTTNLAKLLEDAANGILWLDDCAICSMDLKKFYIEAEDKCQRPKIVLSLTVLGKA